MGGGEKANQEEGKKETSEMGGGWRRGLERPLESTAEVTTPDEPHCWLLLRWDPSVCRKS